MLQAAPARPIDTTFVGQTEVPLRVLQLGMGWFPERAGGCNRMYHGLMQHLGSAGVYAEGLVAGTPARIHSASRVSAFAPHDAPLPLRLLRARRMLSARDLTQYQLACCHFALYTLPLLHALRDMPLVMHFHGPWSKEGAFEGDGVMTSHVKKWAEQRVYDRARHFIVLSRAFRAVLASEYGIAEDHISIVPGGVDCARFRKVGTQREARMQMNLPLDRPIILAVRRLAPRMGLAALLEAVGELRKRVPEVLVLIAGKGALSNSLDAQIKALNLAQHVRLLGFVPDEQLPTAYRAANISVVPTDSLEGFGLVAAESLAAGTPALVTPIGGLPEVVEELSGNLILPAADSGALAAGMTAALLGTVKLPDETQCQEFAQRYDWGRIAASTAAVYRATVAQSAHPR
jgi:glycosyltransferase involved in cell wall biosynthesis